MVRTTKQVDYTDLAGGTSSRRQTVTSYDSAGRAVLDDQTGTGIPETCTQTSYADNTAAWIRDTGQRGHHGDAGVPGLAGQPDRCRHHSPTPGPTTTARPASAAAPTAGNPTMVTEATANNAGTLTFVTQSTTGLRLLRPGASPRPMGEATPRRPPTPRPTAGR